MMGWSEIETAPRDGSWVLAIMAGSHPSTHEPYVPAVVRWDEDHDCFTVADEDEREHDDERWSWEQQWALTHWMRLPDPPGAA